MRIWLAAPLMAATILTSIMPSVAQAQDGQRRGGMSRGGEANGATSAPNMRGGNWGRQNSDSFRQNRPTAGADSSTPRATARPDWNQRGNDNWRGRTPGSNPGNSGVVQAPVTRPTPAPRPSMGTEARPETRPRADWQQRRPDGVQDNRGNWSNRDRNRDGIADARQRDNIRGNDVRDRPNNARDRNDSNWSNNRNDRNDRNWQSNRNWSGNNNSWNRGNSYYGNNARLSDRDRWAGNSRWSQNWRRDNRYDWQRYRSINRDYYRMPAYYAPHGWNYGYRRFSVGIFMSSMLFSQNYWIGNPGYYRLPPAYGTLQWVRYYDDALLVDMRDGYVVDVVHNFFW